MALAQGKQLASTLKWPSLRRIYYSLTNCHNSSVSDRWHFTNMQSFGGVSIKSSQSAMFVIQPVDPVQNPEQNQVLVKVSQAGQLKCTKTKNNSVTTCDITPNKPAGLLEEMSEKPLHCQHLLPIKYSISADMCGDAAIHVKGMESEQVTVNTELGSCFLDSIKCESVCLSCGGPVISQSSLHANGKIKTTFKTPISIDRALGSSMSFMTEAGDVNIKSLYIEKCNISTDTGSVSIGACYKHTTINIAKSGNLHIGTLGGDLDANINDGNVDLQISEHDNVHIHVNKGNVTIKLSDSIDTRVHLVADNVDIAENLIFEEESVTSNTTAQKHQTGIIRSSESNISSDKLLTVTCKKGDISLSKQDWLSSLGFGSLNK